MWVGERGEGLGVGGLLEVGWARAQSLCLVRVINRSRHRPPATRISHTADACLCAQIARESHMKRVITQQLTQAIQAKDLALLDKAVAAGATAPQPPPLPPAHRSSFNNALSPLVPQRAWPLWGGA